MNLHQILESQRKRQLMFQMCRNASEFFAWMKFKLIKFRQSDCYEHYFNITEWGEHKRKVTGILCCKNISMYLLLKFSLPGQISFVFPILYSRKMRFGVYGCRNNEDRADSNCDLLYVIEPIFLSLYLWYHKNKFHT